METFQGIVPNNEGIIDCSPGFLLSVFIAPWFIIFHPGVCFCLACGRRSVFSRYSPVIADEEILPICGPDGHYFLGVALKHFLHGLQLFLAAHANFNNGVSVRCRYEALK